MRNDEKGLPPEEEERDGDMEELEEFLFFRRLEENGGKPSFSMVGMGCFTAFPVMVVVVAALYFLMRYMYI